jgi:hypothetical protein
MAQLNCFRACNVQPCLGIRGSSTHTAHLPTISTQSFLFHGPVPIPSCLSPTYCPIRSPLKKQKKIYLWDGTYGNILGKDVARGTVGAALASTQALVGRTWHTSVLGKFMSRSNKNGKELSRIWFELIIPTKHVRAIS